MMESSKTRDTTEDSLVFVPFSLQNKKSDERSASVEKKIISEEAFYEKNSKIVIKYFQHEKVFRNGKLEHNKINTLTIIKHPPPARDSNKSRKKSKTPSSGIQLEMNSPPKVTVSCDEVRTRKYFYIGICVALITILVGLLRISLYTEPIKIEELQYDLSNNVLSQHAAIKTIVNSVEQLMQPSPKTIITCLIGSTGIGKTYSMNILKNHVDWKSIHIFRSEDLTAINFLHIRFWMILSDYNILIFDDLKKGHLERVQSIIKKIVESNRSNVLIIAIFNIQETDSNLNFIVKYEHSHDIKMKLERLSDFFSISKFNEFDITAVEDWLRNRLIANDVDEKYHLNIIAELLEGQDYKNFGLKGIHGKLLIEINKYQELSS